MTLLEKAVSLCTVLEPRLRGVGWHIGLTGSTLYGQRGPKKIGRKSDIDLILYPNNDGEAHPETFEELMKAMMIKKYRLLLPNPLSPVSYPRDVIRVMTKDGIQVDFFLLVDVEDRIPGI